MLFFINPTYQGPVLIRGKQLDGPGMIRFNGTNDPPLVPDNACLIFKRFICLSIKSIFYLTLLHIYVIEEREGILFYERANRTRADQDKV